MSGIQKPSAWKDCCGRRVNRPSEDIVVRDCRFTLGHGVSVGSEMSGDVRRVFFERCAGDKLPLSFAINIRSCPGRGGTIEGIRMRDCTHRAIALNAVAVELDYSYNGPNASGALPTLRDIVIERVTCEGVGEQALAFVSRADAPIRDLRLRDVSIRAGKPASIRNVVGLTMENCFITNIARTRPGACAPCSRARRESRWTERKRREGRIGARGRRAAATGRLRKIALEVFE
jgi:hypothetical protein